MFINDLTIEKNNIEDCFSTSCNIYNGSENYSNIFLLFHEMLINDF